MLRGHYSNQFDFNDPQQPALALFLIPIKTKIKRGQQWQIWCLTWQIRYLWLPVAAKRRGDDLPGCGDPDGRALPTQPKLIICDEPVSALDVAVQAQILNLLRRLQKEFGLTYLFISHDLGVVQHMSDKIAVMYMGRIVEFADRMSLFNTPRHPYTKALLSAVPRVDHARGSAPDRLLIPGDPPDPINLPPGCRFASRCPFAEEVCRASEPEAVPVGPSHLTACHRLDDLAAL